MIRGNPAFTGRAGRFRGAVRGVAQVKAKIIRVTTNMKRDLETHLGTECMRIMYDTIQEFPEAPVDTAALISSGSVLVNKRLIAVSPYVGGKANVITVVNRHNPKDAHVGTIIFGVDYAFKVHSGQVKLRSASAGPEFLSEKLDENRLKNIAKRVRLRL